MFKQLTILQHEVVVKSVCHGQYQENEQLQLLNGIFFIVFLLKKIKTTNICDNHKVLTLATICNFNIKRIKKLDFARFLEQSWKIMIWRQQFPKSCQEIEFAGN